MISYITSKTFPQRLTVDFDTISEVISRPVNQIERSELLKDDPEIMGIITSANIVGLIDEFSMTLQKLEKTFTDLVDMDSTLVIDIKELSRYIGTIRPATTAEESEARVKVPLEQVVRERYSSYFVGLTEAEINARVGELIAMGVTE